MKKRMIIVILSVCTVLVTGCGVETVHALEPMQTVEETEVIATETMEATELEGAETDVVAFLESTEMPDETVSITDADYIAMAKECEQEFKIIDGKEYNCDIAVEILGCTYIYEFPEEDVKVEECSFIFEHSETEIIDWNSDGSKKKVVFPVSITIDSNKYLIGTADVFLVKREQSDNFLIEEINYYYDDKYRKSIDYDLLKAHADKVSSVIIRSYNPKERTIELCYVTLLEFETATTYEIEKEEWVTMPLSEEIKIISYSLGGTSSVHISESVFAERVDGYKEGVYFFATVAEREGSIVGIMHEYLP